MKKTKSVYTVIGSIVKTGGTERSVTNLANILCDLEYCVTIISICTNNVQLPYYKLDSRVCIRHINMGEIPISIIRKMEWFYSVHKKLDVIIPHKSIVIGTGHNLNIILSLFKNTHFYTIGCEHIQKETIPLYSRIIMKMLYCRLGALVVLSNSARKKYRTYNRNIEVIPNALPYETDPPKNSLHKRIIMVGRLDKNKGYDRAIPIFMFLHKRFPEWKVVIYGDGIEKNNIESLLITNHLNNVEINKPVQNINEIYKECDLMLMTSHSEAMPMVILEANSFGLPVIAYECEGTKELILNSKTGFIIDDDNCENFCYKLEILITDSSLFKKFAHNAYEFSKLYSKERVSAKWWTFINKLTNVTE